jgi:ubiquitin thioesterase protein OTUB1
MAAIAFGYFEAMIRLGDVAKFDEEEARLSSMHNLLNQVGFHDNVYMDFAEEVFDLLRKLALALQTSDTTAADLLLQSFNDYGISMSIITYFKVRPSHLPVPPHDANGFSSWQAHGSKYTPTNSSPSS